MICKPKRKLDHARKAIFHVLVKPFPGGVDIALVGSEWKLHLDSSVFRCMFACLIQECMQEAIVHSVTKSSSQNILIAVFVRVQNL